MEYLVALVVAVSAVLGLVIGSFLNVVAYRVPAHISLLRESRCPHCDATVKPWQNVPVVSWVALRGRCASCSSPISGRYPVVEALTGAGFGVVTWWLLATSDISRATSADAWSLGLIIVAFLYFASISIVLTLIDLDTHRLPNNIVLPSYLVAGALLTAAAILGDEWTALLRAAIGMAAMYGFYLALRLVRPGGMGGGDVKLAGVVGLYLGWVGWGALAVGAFAAFFYGGVFGIALLIGRRAGRKTAIPFGPWMILGAWTGVFAGDAVGRWYVNLITAG
ncbi:A24 family peptidase [uncultured Microbacterium sp.]|uniref:prepilin peptidase n=1 Tax=uncultured Microbacterium sp. TaxID=191216 RepID=UPI0028D8918F|nr:A24 family peptidase [uncultured Microbacterium sp.]